jgi:hypothetical protein
VRIQALEAEVAKLRQTPEEQESAYLASLPEAIRKEREADKVEKAALREELRVEKARREQGDYIAKTREYQAVGLAPDDWDVLQAIDTLPEKSRGRVLHLLKAAGEQLRVSGLFRAVGFDGNPDASSAGERIAKTARERAVASNGTLTYEQAYTKVIEEQPELLRQYRAEQRS